MMSTSDSLISNNRVQCRVFDKEGFRLRAEAVCFRNHLKKEVRLIKCRNFDCWTFPGGGLEPNETAAVTAVRELGEEAGIVGTVIDEAGIYEDNGKKSKKKTYVYTVLASEPLENWEDKCWRETKWCGITEAVELLRKDKASLLKEIVNCSSLSPSDQSTRVGHS